MKKLSLLSVLVFSIILLLVSTSCVDIQFGGALGESLEEDFKATVSFEFFSDTPLTPPQAKKYLTGTTVYAENLPRPENAPEGKKFAGWYVKQNETAVSNIKPEETEYYTTTNINGEVYCSFTSFTILGNVILHVAWKDASAEPDNPENARDGDVSIDILVTLPVNCIKLELQPVLQETNKYNITINNLNDLSHLQIDKYYWFIDGTFLDTTTYDSKTIELSDIKLVEKIGTHEVVCVIYIDNAVIAYGKTTITITDTE